MDGGAALNWMMVVRNWGSSEYKKPLKWPLSFETTASETQVTHCQTSAPAGVLTPRRVDLFRYRSAT